MASTKVGREMSPLLIASRRTRRCSTQARHTSTVCSTVSSWRSTQAPGRIVPPNQKQEPPETTVFGEGMPASMGQPEREATVASLQLLLEEGPYRRDCGVPMPIDYTTRMIGITEYSTFFSQLISQK